MMTESHAQIGSDGVPRVGCRWRHGIEQQRLMAMLRWFLALVILSIASPLMMLFIAGVQCTSPGAFFFRQTRIGRHGQAFEMWKLRTMVPAAEDRLRHILTTSSAAAEWAAYGRLHKDPRIAGPFGRWARRFSIDELPQLVNVLTGEMAFIGPRPLPLDQTLKLDAASRQIRGSVLPGLTGLWQVRGRSETTLRQMVRVDLLYIRRRSVLLDLYVLSRTPAAVLFSRGAY